MNKLLTAVMCCWCVGCATAQQETLPAIGDGLDKVKSFYVTAKELQVLVCSPEQGQLRFALTQVGLNPDVLQQACVDAAVGLDVGREAVNQIGTAYNEINENLGE